MEIFRVAFKPARYQALRYTEMPADDEFDVFIFGGDQASRWRVREVRPSEPSFERPDIWHLEGSAGTLVFPASVAQALEPHLSESSDPLPLSFEGSDEPF